LDLEWEITIFSFVQHSELHDRSNYVTFLEGRCRNAEGNASKTDKERRESLSGFDVTAREKSNSPVRGRLIRKFDFTFLIIKRYRQRSDKSERLARY